jgi:hypothetical protein
MMDAPFSFVTGIGNLRAELKYGRGIEKEADPELGQVMALKLIKKLGPDRSQEP